MIITGTLHDLVAGPSVVHAKDVPTNLFSLVLVYVSGVRRFPKPAGFSPNRNLFIAEIKAGGVGEKGARRPPMSAGRSHAMQSGRIFVLYICILY